MDELITQLQPYANVVSAVLSLATLGFVLNLVKLARDAAADRVKVYEDRLAAAGDRLAAAKEDQERTEKWQKRERERLEADLKEKQNQLESVLKNAGLDLSSLALGAGIKAAADGLREEVEALTEGLRSQLQALPPVVASVSDVQESAKVTLAKGDLAAGRWATAASLLDEVTKDETVTEWKYHFSRGVAHANARGGSDSDLAALRAYNDAIAFAPAELEKNWRARLFTYRAAIYKRLGRTEEALSDLMLARTLATAPYEIADNLYNLACVYALRGERQQMLEALRSLQKCGGSLGGVRAHLHDYFVRFKDDLEFKAIVGI
jgi:tetratricopeptide (TPR) repeat protein